MSETRRDSITVSPPSDCDPNFPQLFCSTFISTTHATCTARLGSAVVCDDESVSAIVLNDGSCSSHGSAFLLNHQSIGDYEDWIRKVSSAKSLTLSSSFLAFTALLFYFK